MNSSTYRTSSLRIRHQHCSRQIYLLTIQVLNLMVPVWGSLSPHANGHGVAYTGSGVQHSVVCMGRSEFGVLWYSRCLLNGFVI